MEREGKRERVRVREGERRRWRDGIADDLTIMGPIKVITPFFLDMRDFLKSAFHAEVDIRKTGWKEARQFGGGSERGKRR